MHNLSYIVLLVAGRDLRNKVIVLAGDAKVSLVNSAVYSLEQNSTDSVTSLVLEGC